MLVLFSPPQVFGHFLRWHSQHKRFNKEIAQGLPAVIQLKYEEHYLTYKNQQRKKL